MFQMDKEAAIETAVEIAKVLCAARSDKFLVDADSANEIADFIETLYKRLTEGAGQSE